jgi:trans-aconitate methyltransferase
LNTPESDKYETTFKSWNDVSELYHDRFSTETLYNDTYDQLCDFIEKNVKLLEIGCGPGNMTKYLLEKRPDLKIKGIDVAPKMIELARQINPQAKFEVMDARDISKLNEKFDAIVSGFCMPYLSDEDSSRLILDCAALLKAII